jgi:outer membrane protein assembly factor BamE (lipoprotein component of BamABCDE complex)
MEKCTVVFLLERVTMKNRFVVSLLLLLAITGCSTIAPKYNTDFNNISQLRREKLNAARVGTVTKETAAKSDVDSLTIRSGSFLSPYGSYTAYLAEALKQELDDARLLDPMSQIEVSAVLLKNSIDVPASTGVAEIEARFVVRNAATTKFDKIKIVRQTWESSFAANMAVPRAHQNYPIAMQKLIGQLFSDPDFIAALK